MSAGGTVVTFELDGGKDEAFALMNAPAGHRHLEQPRRLQVAHHPPGDDDAPPARPEARAAVGITDGILRVSVGLEDVRDLVDDLRRALA